MSLRRWIGIGWLARRVITELSGIRAGLDAQNQILTRLADRLAPQPPDADESRPASGIDFLDPGELDAAAAYIQQMRQDLGRDPTEDELLLHLAERDTLSLQGRLAERHTLLDKSGRR